MRAGLRIASGRLALVRARKHGYGEVVRVHVHGHVHGPERVYAGMRIMGMCICME